MTNYQRTTLIEKIGLQVSKPIRKNVPPLEVQRNRFYAIIDNYDLSFKLKHHIYKVILKLDRNTI